LYRKQQKRKIRHWKQMKQAETIVETEEEARTRKANDHKQRLRKER